MHPVVAKFGRYVKFGRAETVALAKALSHPLQSFGAHTDIWRAGQNPQAMLFMLSGWACRYKQLEDGRRQTVGLVLPGDICDASVFTVASADYSLATLTPVVVASVTRAEYQQLTASSKRLARAFQTDSFVDTAIQREWTVNVGQRRALERLAHLFCEIFTRLEAVGLTSGSHCEFPIKQNELGECTSLSVVHVNRTLQQMRAAGLVALSDRELTIPDMKRLSQVGGFNDEYLRLFSERALLETSA